MQKMEEREKPAVAIGMAASQYIHSGLAPWCLAAGVQTYAPWLRPAVVESTVNRPPQVLAAALAAEKPRVVGLCCYIWNIRFIRELAPLLKAALPGVPLVLGGPEVSYCAAEVFERIPEADYILSGEGEKSFAQLCAALCAGVQPVPGAIGGLCTRSAPDAPPCTPAGDWPAPYTPAYFAALHGRIAYLETSRGCPFSCAFCLSGRCGSVRFLPVERAERELLALAHSGAKTVKLVDRTFNCNKGRALRLWRFILERYGREIPAGVCFHFEIGGDLLDDECIALLRSAPAGSLQLEIGLQSFTPAVLEAVHRTADPDRLCANIRALTEKGNLHVHVDLIAGLPSETLPQFAAGFDRAWALGAQQLQLGFLKLLYGSALRQSAAADGCIYDPEPPYEVFATPALSAAQLQRLHGVADAVDRVHNSGRFSLTLAYALQASGLGPFELFCRLADGLAGRDPCRLSLDEYTALVQAALAAVPGIQPAALRDALVCDRLASNSTGRLPLCLRRYDPAGLKAAAKALPPAAPGTRRGLALLYGSRRAVWADYEAAARSPVTGRWPLHFCNFDTFLSES